MTDDYENEILPRDEIAYTDPATGTRHIGVVESDPEFRGGLCVGGRSIMDILENCRNVKVIS